MYITLREGRQLLAPSAGPLTGVCLLLCFNIIRFAVVHGFKHSGSAIIAVDRLDTQHYLMRQL